jgi:hypothetical protein
VSDVEITSNPLMEGGFATLGAVTYQVRVLGCDELLVHRDAHDRSGSWQPDLSPDPVLERVPCAEASQIFGVRTFAVWRGVGMRITGVDHARGKATAWFIPNDLAVYGPPDWPRPLGFRTPPHGGMSSLRSHGSDADNEFAGDVRIRLLTDIRQTRVDFPRDADGDLERPPSTHI